VINVSWEEAKAYAVWLSKVTGKPFRLPTEAEWEYAARAKSTTRYWWGDNVNEGRKVWANCANCGSEWDNKKTAPVGSFPENGFGLHDMHGNVWEWVEDDWHDSYNKAPDDGSAWVDEPRGSDRVLRGGGWGNDARLCRSAVRYGYRPDVRDFFVGFRLSRSVALGP
jgi:formylglycine-generating enzyme required for sulfatase activity